MLKLRSFLFNSIILFLAIGCSSSSDSKAGRETAIESGHHDLDWLLGSWKRINSEEGIVTTEHWSKRSDDIYMGEGLVVSMGDTLNYEQMEIKVVKGHHCFVVTVAEEPPVEFEFIEEEANSFKCENLENEFPKKISYGIDGDLLKAQISGGGPTIDFIFEKEGS